MLWLNCCYKLVVFIFFRVTPVFSVPFIPPLMTKFWGWKGTAAKFELRLVLGVKYFIRSQFFPFLSWRCCVAFHWNSASPCGLSWLLSSAIQFRKSYVMVWKYTKELMWVACYEGYSRLGFKLSLMKSLSIWDLSMLMLVPFNYLLRA